MNLQGWKTEDLQALQHFYEQPSHSWTWDEMVRGASNKAISAREWLESSPPPRAHPLLLPRVAPTETGQVVLWYALAFDEVQAEELREQLRAFVGAVGTTFEGRRYDLSASPTLAESALAKWIGGPWAYRLLVLDGRGAEVRRALRRMQQVWELRPPTAPAAQRTTEGLLSELFEALRRLDESAAQHWFGELRHGGRLGGENLTFLQVEYLAAFGRWKEITDSAYLSLLLKTRRPRRITGLLLEAIWRVEFAQFVERQDAKAAIDYFKTRYQGRLVDPLRTRSGMRRTPVLLMFLLAAVSAEPPRFEQLGKLEQELASKVTTPEQQFVLKLLAAPPAPEPNSKVVEAPLVKAKTAIERKDFDTAWDYLLQAPIDLQVCERLLLCACELQTPDAAEFAKTSLYQLPSEQRERLLKWETPRLHWSRLQSLLRPEERPPADWIEWMDQLRDG